MPEESSSRTRGAWAFDISLAGSARRIRSQTLSGFIFTGDARLVSKAGKTRSKQQGGGGCRGFTPFKMAVCVLELRQPSSPSLSYMEVRKGCPDNLSCMPSHSGFAGANPLGHVP